MEKTSHQTRRIEWIDLARGVAIILVVLAHVPIPHTLKSYIYSFHLPLFFVLSGFLLYGRMDMPAEKFIVKRIKGLVLPYFIFSFIDILFWALVNGAHRESINLQLNGTLLAIRTSPLTVHNSALWFLTSLFVSELAVYGIYRLTKARSTVITLVLAAVFVGGATYNMAGGGPLPWAIDTIPFVAAFLWIGYQFAAHYEKWTRAISRQSSHAIFAASSLAVVSLAAWYVNGRVDMWSSLFGSYLLYMVGGVAGAGLVIMLFDRYVRRAPLLSYIGQNSLIVFALHQQILFVIFGLFFMRVVGRTMPFAGDSSWAHLLNGAVYVALTLLITLPLAYGANKYVPWLVGRPRRRD